MYYIKVYLCFYIQNTRWRPDCSNGWYIMKQITLYHLTCVLQYIDCTHRMKHDEAQVYHANKCFMLTLVLSYTLQSFGSDKPVCHFHQYKILVLLKCD